MVRQKLSGWPAEHLIWWSCLPESDNRFGQRVAAHRVARIPPKLYPHYKYGPQKSWLLERVWTPWAVRHLRRTLEEFNPQAVWVIPHCWSIPPLRGAMASGAVHYHISVHDYVDVDNNVPAYGATRCRRMAAMVDALYTAAKTRDAISGEMALDLEERTRRAPDGIIRYGVNVAKLATLQGMGMQRTTPEIRIAYAGSIQVEEEFILFVNALRRIQRVTPRPVELHFFGAHALAKRSWFDAKWMRERGNLPEDQLTEELRECDWGFSLMALTDHNPRYNRFSFPTKFIGYLAAGLPVIALGHPESSLIKTASAYRVGMCFTLNDEEQFARELLTALSLANPRQHYAKKILDCACREFDEQMMRANLYRWLGAWKCGSQAEA